MKQNLGPIFDTTFSVLQKRGKIGKLKKVFWWICKIFKLWFLVSNARCKNKFFKGIVCWKSLLQCFKMKQVTLNKILICTINRLRQTTCKVFIVVNLIRWKSKFVQIMQLCISSSQTSLFLHFITFFSHKRKTCKKPEKYM